MAASEEQMSKFLITTPNTVLERPSIQEYDKEDEKDEIRDELTEEIKEELIDEFQSAIDDRECELDSLITSVEENLQEAKQAIHDALSTLEDLTSLTAFNVRDNI